MKGTTIMKIYLASPLFTEEERKNIMHIVTPLRETGNEVYVPMEHTVENAWDLPNHIWAKKVFEEDVKAIREADCVIAITYGMTDDAGTAWEIGFAYGLGKEIIVVPVNTTTYSLMVCQSADSLFSKNGDEIPLWNIIQS